MPGKRGRTYSARYTSYRPTRRARDLAFRKYHKVAPAKTSSFRMGRRRAALRALANPATMGPLGIEIKYLDCGTAAAAISQLANVSLGMVDPAGIGSTGCLSAPAQGDGPTNRDGNRIWARQLYFRGVVYTSTIEAGTDPSIPCRIYVAIVLDTQTNGAQMLSSDCFVNPSATQTSNVQPLRNITQWRERFRILREDVFDITPKTLTSTALNNMNWNGVSCHFDWFIPLNIVMNFNQGTTADVANAMDNSLHVVAFSTISTTSPLITYNSRMRFVG